MPTLQEIEAQKSAVLASESAVLASESAYLQSISEAEKAYKISELQRTTQEAFKRTANAPPIPRQFESANTKQQQDVAVKANQYSSDVDKYKASIDEYNSYVDVYNKEAIKTNELLQKISEGKDIIHTVNISTREYSRKGNNIFEFKGYTDAGGRYSNEYASGDVLLSDRGGTRVYTTKEEAIKTFVNTAKGKFGLNENDRIYVDGVLFQESNLSPETFNLAKQVSSGALSFEQSQIAGLKAYRDQLKQNFGGIFTEHNQAMASAPIGSEQSHNIIGAAKDYEQIALKKSMLENAQQWESTKSYETKFQEVSKFASVTPQKEIYTPESYKTTTPPTVIFKEESSKPLSEYPNTPIDFRPENPLAGQYTLPKNPNAVKTPNWLPEGYGQGITKNEEALADTKGQRFAVSVTKWADKQRTGIKALEEKSNRSDIEKAYASTAMELGVGILETGGVIGGVLWSGKEKPIEFAKELPVATGKAVVNLPKTIWDIGEGMVISPYRKRGLVGGSVAAATNIAGLYVFSKGLDTIGKPIVSGGKAVVRGGVDIFKELSQVSKRMFGDTTARARAIVEIDPITGESYGKVVHKIDTDFAHYPSEYTNTLSPSSNTYSKWLKSPSGYSSEWEGDNFRQPSWGASKYSEYHNIPTPPSTTIDQTIKTPPTPSKGGGQSTIINLNEKPIDILINERKRWEYQQQTIQKPKTELKTETLDLRSAITTKTPEGILSISQQTTNPTRQSYVRPSILSSQTGKSHLPSQLKKIIPTTIALDYDYSTVYPINDTNDTNDNIDHKKLPLSLTKNNIDLSGAKNQYNQYIPQAINITKPTNISNNKVKHKDIQKNNIDLGSTYHQIPIVSHIQAIRTLSLQKPLTKTTQIQSQKTTIKTRTIQNPKETQLHRPKPPTNKKPEDKLDYKFDKSLKPKQKAQKKPNPWYPASLENVVMEELALGGKQRAIHIASRKTTQKYAKRLATTGQSIPTLSQSKSKKTKSIWRKT